MNISIFEVSGPVMIGPSSTLTAGAARLWGAARQIVGRSFHRVDFELISQACIPLDAFQPFIQSIVTDAIEDAEEIAIHISPRRK